jgi:signal peptidase I
MGIFSILKIGRVKVEGPSMEPALYSGDWLAVRWFSPQHDAKAKPLVQHGDIVLVERLKQPGIFYIKRLIATQDEAKMGFQLWVEGDNPSGTDSRSWGWLERGEVVGKVLFRYKKAKR